MTKSKRNAANAKPITSNPLFPAVVALWFGALFGLGSLAVRPSLLENLVLQSHIDLVIPAAAPPLGITARILLALVMAAFGAVLGIMLARRLARPKTEHHERKRGAKDLSTLQPRVRSRDAHPDAPARRPISAHEELGEDRPVANGPGMLAQRRRALALIDDEPGYVPQDMAPLPGGGTVQPLDLATLALPAEPEPQPAVSAPQAPVNAATVLDWTNAAPIAPAAESVKVEQLEQISSEAAHRDGRQVFGMTAPEAPAPAERQIFGVVAQGDHLPQDFVKAAGFQTSVFDTPEPSPLFERLDAPEAATVAVAPELAPAVVAVPTEPLPSPSSLGMTDLAARLADSMRRRRERSQSAPVAVEAKPEPAANFDSPAAELPVMPAAFAATAEPVPIPSGYTAPAEPEAAPEPAATQLSPVPVLAQFTAAAPAAPQPSQSNPLDMPAAMRPLALDAFLEDDAGFDDASLLPPRHIAMPAPVSQPAPFAPPVAAATAPATEEAEQSGEDSLADAADDNPYASLLAVAPARQSFVRIEEPAADDDQAIEPVVIFPGQAAQVVALAAAPAPAGEDGGFRRFDAPASAGQGQPVAAGIPTPAIAPDEAAQALRAALSNLQRMSGAA